MSSLILEHVGKQFGGVKAVVDISLTVFPGKISGLIGPNGAGKTTVVNLIAGLLKLSNGRILLGGHDISAAQPHIVARAGIARTFQNIRLLAEATVLENVMIGYHQHERASVFAKLLALPSSRHETSAMRRSAHELLGQFKMEQFADFPAGGLAYGHQRRVEMMRAIASQPKILLLDEPVAGMNDIEADELGSIFRNLCEAGMGILLIEHNTRFVAKYCSHVSVLDAGRTIFDGTPQEAMRDPAVIRAYLGGHS